VNVRRVRELTKLTPAEFCLLFGFRIGDLTAWESGAAMPRGHESVFLTVIEAMPADCLLIANELRQRDAAFSAGQRSESGQVIPFREK
jgi:hypothetical protein